MSPQRAGIEIHELQDLGDQREFCLLSTLRNVLGFTCWLADSRIPLKDVRLPIDAPGYASSFVFMFGRMPQFIEGVASIGFSADYLKLPVRRDDTDLRQMLLRPLPLIVLQYRHERMFSKRIRDLLQSKPGLASAVEIAAELHTSSRSLYRHLADEVTSLQQIKDEVIRDLAKEQLVRTASSLKQIARRTWLSKRKHVQPGFQGVDGYLTG